MAALDGSVGLEQALLDAENIPLIRAGHGELAEREMRTLFLARRPAPRLPVPGRATILLKKKTRWEKNVKAFGKGRTMVRPG